MSLKTQKKMRSISNYILFMGPAVLLFVVIGLIPFFYEIWYSFTNWDGIHADYKFVGLKNYLTILRTTSFVNSFKNALLFALIQ